MSFEEWLSTCYKNNFYVELASCIYMVCTALKQLHEYSKSACMLLERYMLAFTVNNIEPT